MDLGLDGRRALVTGASRGIGAAVAARLAGEGVQVVLLGRDDAALARQRAAIEQRGGHAMVVNADLGEIRRLQAALQEVIDSTGGVDIVVHAAGSYPAGALLNSPPEDFVDLYAGNAVSYVALAQAFAAPMIAAGFGRFVAVTDIAALMPLPGSAAYTASKASLLHLAKLLSKELAGTGVTSNAVSPGLIRTPGAEKLFGDLAASYGWPSNDWAQLEPLLLEHVLAVPVGRAGQPDDIARAVTFLCSEAAEYISGAHLAVDGGASTSL